MRMSEVRARARQMNLEPGRMKKADLIRAMQRAEGFEPCFGEGRKDCPYTDCCFRGDCVLDVPASLQDQE